MSTDDQYDYEQARQQAFDELQGIIRQHRGYVLSWPIGSRHWQEIFLLDNAVNRASGWRETRPIFLVPPGGRVFAILEVRVVPRLTGQNAVEITEAQEERLREIEGRNGQTVPVTGEEFAAFEREDPDELLRLARNPSSNLHHLICWDDKEAIRLTLFKRMFGDGN